MRKAIGSMVVFATFMMVGCSTAPKTQAERRSLVAEANAAVASMTAKDASLRDVMDRGVGYAVYPNVGAAGAIVGGAYGRGVVFEDDRPVGFTELNQGALGAIIGGQNYAQMIVFQNEDALNRLRAGNFDIGAEASAVAIKAGIAAATRFEDGVAIFQMPKGGLMATAAVTGQKMNFQPMDDSFEEGEAVTAGGRIRARREGDAGDDRGSAPAVDSAYNVDENLQPNEQMRLRTDGEAQQAAEEAAREQRQ